MIQYVATEYGVVNLTGLSLLERAQAMASIATQASGRSSSATLANILGPDRLLAFPAVYRSSPLVHCSLQKSFRVPIYKKSCEENSSQLF